MLVLVKGILFSSLKTVGCFYSVELLVVLCSAKLFFGRKVELGELVGQSLYQSYEDGACAPPLVMCFFAQFSINKTRPAHNLFLFF